MVHSLRRIGANLVLLLILCFVLVSFPKMGIVNAEPKTIVVPDDYPSIQEAVDAQASSVVWSQTYGGYDGEVAYSLVETSDGGYAIAGQTSSFGAGDNDVLLVKTDAYGNMEWNQTYGEADFEGAYSLIKVSDGGYALAGYTYAHAFGERFEDGLLIQTAENGNMEWCQTYGNICSNSFRSLVESSDGGYALTGNFGDYSSPRAADFWLVKTDEYIGDVPEFLLWIVMLSVLTLLAVAVAVAIYKRRLKRQTN